MIRAILLDIDGTLINSQGVITPKTRQALKEVQKRGVRLAIASGRADRALYKWAIDLEMDQHNGIFICYNGAKVMDCQTKEVFFHQAIEPAKAQAVLRHVRSFDVHPIIIKDEYMYTDDVFAGMIHKGKDGPIFNVVEYEARSNDFILCEKRDMAAFADYPVEKILTYGEPEYLETHWEELREPFKDTLASMFTAPFYYEFTAKGVDKAKAIDTVFSRLGYAREELMAFGDAKNDLSMIRYAGIGVAMENAVEEVKQAADEVTLSSNEDGIAASIYRHILSSEA